MPEDGNCGQDWKTLCEQIAREHNSQKLNDLVQQLNRVLANHEQPKAGSEKPTVPVTVDSLVCPICKNRDLSRVFRNKTVIVQVDGTRSVHSVIAYKCIHLDHVFFVPESEASIVLTPPSVDGLGDRTR
jgi:RNA polymerase subunit RPABC4/transcription elongation factor Spt4